MKSFCVSALCLIAPTVCAAPAGELPAEVADAFATYAALPGKLIPHMQQAQDKESADAAAASLNKALPAIYAARDKLHKMPRLSTQQNQQVRLVYGQRMREEWARMYEEITRLQNARCYQSATFAEVFHLLCMMIEK